MKTVLLLIFTFYLNSTFGQIEVDPAVRDQYNNAYQSLPLKHRQSFEKLQKEILSSAKKYSKQDKDLLASAPFNIAIVTLQKIDTLNKEQIEGTSYSIEQFPVLFCEANFISDTLMITLTPGPSLNSSIDIKHYLFHDSIQSEFYLWEKFDRYFRNSLQEKDTDALSIPFSTYKFVLSDRKFTIGKTIYGYADIKSNPYYQSDVNSKNGYTNISVHFQYYFKFVVAKKEPED